MKNTYKKVLLTLVLGLTSVSPLSADVVEVEEVYPVTILGGGIGALTSSIYLSRAGITPVVIEGKVPGGALTQSHSVQNWPGEIEITGMELADKIHKQAEVNGSNFRTEEVIAVDFSARPFTLTTQDIDDPEKIHKIRTNSCIIAMGTTPNFLGVPGEQQHWTRGVYNCALCDGALYKNKIIAIVGGGDSALTEAHYLSNIAKTVHIFVRRDSFRTVEEKRKNELEGFSNVQIHYNTIVKEIKGNGQKVESVIIEDIKEKKQAQVDLDAVFLAIGSKPNSRLFQGQLELDRDGYIMLVDDRQTSVEGVFAVGDIVKGLCKQAICAAGEAALSTIQAEKYLTTAQISKKPYSIPANKIKDKSHSTVIEITSVEQFEKELRDNKHPIVVDFYATWCGPCKRLAPKFDDWAKNFNGKVKFLKVNVDVVSALTEKYHITSMPTVLLIEKDRGEVDRKIGASEIQDLIKKLEKMFSHKRA